MATDLVLYLTDRPGKLAQVGRLLGERGVNIEGVSGVAHAGGPGEIHILVEDRAAAITALRDAEISVAFDREVLVVPIEDQPGTLGAVGDKLAAAGVNVNLVYLATNMRLVLGTDNPAKAVAALS